MPDGTLSSPKLYALLNHLQDAVFAIEGGKFVFVNKQVTRLFGYSEAELLSRPIIDYIHEDDREMVMARYAARQHGDPVPDEYAFHIVTKSGAVRVVNMRAGTVQNDDGSVTSIGSLQDITEQRRTQRALAHSQADIASILNNMPDIFYRTDMQGIITLMSPSCVEAIGYSPEEMIGRPLANFYCDPREREKVVQAIVEGGGQARQVEACLVHKDGSAIWISTNAYIRLDAEGRPVCVEGIARNISERKAMEEQLSLLAKVDDLTQLLNRRQFFIEAENQLRIAKRYQRPLSVLMLDLDWFKSINDRFGHQLGDQVLTYFANACRELFRATDLIGRMGGEEFAILMPESPIEAARGMVERLRQYLQKHPVQAESQSIQLTFSAGLVSLTDETQDIDTLLRQADRLLYDAKERGRNQVVCEAFTGPQA